MKKKFICVFCGSAKGQGQEYLNLGKNLGKMIADSGLGLVYGGASIGLMASVANGVLENGGEVIGVIPKALVDYEVAHDQLTKLHVVETMHERKQLMYDLSSVFLTLPGGMGTMDEMFEVLTWTQLKYHDKKSYILNFNGFYDSLLAFLSHSHKQGFIKAEHLNLLQELKNADELKEILGNYFKTQ